MERRDPLDALLHQVANLVAVVQTQAAAARALGSADAAHKALRTIEDCARRTQEELQRYRNRG